MELTLQPKTFWLKQTKISFVKWWQPPALPCPTCNGFGEVVIRDGYINHDIPCHCVLREHDRRLLAEAQQFDQFPAERYADVSFETLVTPEGSPAALVQWNKAVKGVKAFIADPTGFLTLTGTYGSGKTHLAALIRQYAPLDPIWINVVQLTSGFTALYSARNGELDRLLTVLSSVPLLICDEIGRGGLENSAGVNANLYTIINNRYNDRLPTVFTSNVTYDVFTKAAPALASRVFEKDPSGRDNLLYLIVNDFRRREKGA